MLNDALSVFTAWVPVIEELTEKGTPIAKSLEAAITAASTMKPEDLVFTACDPLRKGAATQYALGTVEGNAAFLSGRINPAFRIKPEHYLFLNPLLSKSEAEEMHRRIVHPANPTLWRMSGLTARPEGPADGFAHPQQALRLAKAVDEQDALMSGMSVELSGYPYLAVPSQQVLFDASTRYPLSWNLFRYSYIAASEPEMTDAMNAPLQEADLLTEQTAQKSFVDDAYAFVKSRFPTPGAVVPFDLDTGETAYALVGCDSVSFVNREGKSVELNHLGKSFTSVSLVQGQDPVILYAVATSILNLDMEPVVEMTHVVPEYARETNCDLEDDFLKITPSEEPVGL